MNIAFKIVFQYLLTHDIFLETSLPYSQHLVYFSYCHYIGFSLLRIIFIEYIGYIFFRVWWYQCKNISLPEIIKWHRSELQLFLTSFKKAKQSVKRTGRLCWTYSALKFHSRILHLESSCNDSAGVDLFRLVI